MDVASRRKLDDVILRTKFSSLRWTTDNRGVFYTTYAGALESANDAVPKRDEKTTEDTKKNTEVTFLRYTGSIALHVDFLLVLSKANEVSSTKIEVTRTDIQEVYYHRLGTPRSSDVCLARCMDELDGHFFSVETSDDGQYLLASISKGTLRENKLWFLRLSNSSDSIVQQPQWTKLIDTMDSVYDFVTSQGDLLYLRTNAQAPNFRLITMNTKTNEVKEVIAENTNDILEDVTRVHDKYLLVRYLSHVKSVLYLYEMESGKQRRQFDLPIGNIGVW